MLITISNLFANLILNILLQVFSDVVKQMFLSRPSLTCSMLKTDILYTMADICFLSIQCFRAFSVLRPYEYQALAHDRNRYIQLILPKITQFGTKLTKQYL